MKYKKYVLSGVLAALVFVFTFATNLRVPMPNGGYIHLGDFVVYISGVILPFPFSALSAAIGGTLADVLSGAAVWAPFTFVIKGLMASVFVFSTKGKLFSALNLSLAFIACIINVVGYYIAEAMIVSNFVTPLMSVLPTIIQSVSSLVLFTIFSFSFNKRFTGLNYFS